MNRILLIFVDGVGIGADDPAINPFSAAPPPHIETLIQEGRATRCPLDATLGISGLPQSGTGQFSLLTGQNGAQRFGRHYGPWVPTALRNELQTGSVLNAARVAGRSVAFANAYPEELIRAATAKGTFVPVGPLRAGPPLAAAGAHVLNRHTSELERGDAVSSEITNEGWRIKLQRDRLPVISPFDAGQNLARIAHGHDLTLYAHYSTDQAGHEQSLPAAIDALRLFDEFVGGVAGTLNQDYTWVIASDHGNLEDASRGHTRNPAFALVGGPHHDKHAARLKSLLDVVPFLREQLNLAPSSTP